MNVGLPNQIAAPNRRLRLGLVPWSFGPLTSQGLAVAVSLGADANMPKEHLGKERARKYPVLGISIFAILSLLAVVGWLFVARASFTIGHIRFRFLTQSVSKASESANFNTNAVFINIGWNDPAGEITRGRAYGVRLGSRVFEMDTYYAPKGFQGSLSNF